MQKYTSTIYVFITNSLEEYKSDIILGSCHANTTVYISWPQKKGLRLSHWILLLAY